jgi:hypothetical protein
MAQIIDVRGSGGDLVVVGGALTLPLSTNPVSSTLAGSIRYNSTTAALEIYNGSLWVQATGSGSGVTSINGRTGGVTLTAIDVINALGFTPLGSITNLAYTSLPPSLKLLPFVYTSPGLQVANQQVWTIPVSVPFTFPANCTGSYAVAGTASNGPVIYTLAYTRGITTTTIGTINYSAGIKVGNFTSAAYTALIGDIITLTSPPVQDASLANLGIVVLGTRTN